MQSKDKVAPMMNLVKLPANVKFMFDLDQSIDWIRDILIELNEEATEKTPEEYLAETSLKISGEFEKKNRPEMGEILLVRGKILATYATECVRTLKPMKIDLDLALKICFVDEALASSELFAETDETYVENDVYGLYFYDKRTVQFQEMIREQLFLNKEPYPIFDAESKLFGVSS